MCMHPRATAPCSTQQQVNIVHIYIICSRINDNWLQDNSAFINCVRGQNNLQSLVMDSFCFHVPIRPSEHSLAQSLLPEPVSSCRLERACSQACVLCPVSCSKHNIESLQQHMEHSGMQKQWRRGRPLDLLHTQTCENTFRATSCHWEEQEIHSWKTMQKPSSSARSAVERRLKLKSCGCIRIRLVLNIRLCALYKVNSHNNSP